jgi:hypothetical protein
MNLKKIIELTEYRKSMSKIERDVMNAEAKKRYIQYDKDIQKRIEGMKVSENLLNKVCSI